LVRETLPLVSVSDIASEKENGPTAIGAAIVYVRYKHCEKPISALLHWQTTSEHVKKITGIVLLSPYKRTFYSLPTWLATYIIALPSHQT